MTARSDSSNAPHLPPEVFDRVRQATEPTVLLSRDYRILSANHAYRDRYRDDIQPGVDRCHEVSHRYPGPCDQHGEVCPLRACLERDGPARVLHVHHCRAGLEHVDVAMEPVRDPLGRIVAFIEGIRTVRTTSTEPGEIALVGCSPAFNAAVEAVQRVAPSKVPVLLWGESGTGKELFARSVHAESDRSAGPFVPVECSGLTESLFESELFGHEAGAFTGATTRKVGLVEAARGGTLFLDEIGDVPIALQVKLLRLLETGTYRSVGAVERQHADFRLVCATHQDLRASVERGSFRLDLFHRINAFPVRVPPLRERREDLPLLCAQFLQGTGKRMSHAALHQLDHHPFPGNVRELRNLLGRAVLWCDGDQISPAHLGLDHLAPAAPASTVVTLAEAERRYLLWALDHHPGDRTTLARLLGVSERTLYRKLAELGR